MSLVVAVDPGLRGCGVSVYEDGELQFAGYVANPVKVERGPRAWRMMARSVSQAYPLAPQVLVIEGQYLPGYGERAGGGYRKVNPYDLMELTGVVGALVGIYDERAEDIIRYLPSEWTSGVDKQTRIARVQSELTPEELARVELPTKSLQHNVFDAVCLGLFEVRKRGERVAENEDEEMADDADGDV